MLEDKNRMAFAEASCMVRLVDCWRTARLRNTPARTKTGLFDAVRIDIMAEEGSGYHFASGQAQLAGLGIGALHCGLKASLL